MNSYHTSVLLSEAIDLLAIKKGEKYIDATLGGGGHSFEIFNRGGIVLGLDVDQDALDYVEEKNQSLKFSIGKELILAKENFQNIDRVAKVNGFNQAMGILFDLGISSHHVDAPERGFSFQADSALDMRMDRDLQVRASDLVNVLSKKELADMFFRFGEERFARRIADAIITARKLKTIASTQELAEIIKRAVPGKKTKVHPATKTFQALRIVVNDELRVLQEALPKALDLLASKGRVAVISFHSLEDRIVKKAFRDWEERGLGRQVTKKPVVPNEKEVARNNRSRSAKLRVFEKI